MNLPSYPILQRRTRTDVPEGQRGFDRQFYRAYRDCIRIPTNTVEAARNARLRRLNNTLHMLQAFPHWRSTPQHGDIIGASINLLRAMRADGAK
jgi:hypothetical protein